MKEDINYSCGKHNYETKSLKETLRHIEGHEKEAVRLEEK